MAVSAATVRPVFAAPAVLLSLLSFALAPPEAEADRLLARWAPIFVQHVAEGDRGRDRPTRVDFDGDWRALGHWRGQAAAGTAMPAHVYGAAILTETHAYLTYHLFYPLDWARPVCVPRVCHENDLESMLVVVARTPGDGELLLVETKPHHDYEARAGAEAAIGESGRPLVSVEAYGHGLHACRAGDPACAPGHRRIVYVPADEPGIPPAAPEGERVGYRLLPVLDTLWRHRAADGPGASELWDLDKGGPLYYRGAAAGRAGLPLGATIAGRVYGSAARPPWGLKAPSGARGDWFLDPAQVTLARHALPSADRPGARRYVFNPFLDELRAECRDDRCPRPRPVEAAAPVGQAGQAACLLALLAALAHARRRRPAAAGSPRCPGRRPAR